MARVNLTADVLGDGEPTPPPAEPVREAATAGPVGLVYLSARVPRPLRDRLQMQAIREGRPVVKLLTEAVENYLSTHEST